MVVEEDNEEPVKKHSDRHRAEDNMKDRPSQSQSQNQNQNQTHEQDQDQDQTKDQGDGQPALGCDEGDESDETDSEEEEAFDIDEYV